MNVIDNRFIKVLKKNMIFILLYTTVFILIYKTFHYISPFLVGGIIAFLINPISEKLRYKFNINKGVSTLVLSFIAVIIFVVLAGLLIMAGIDSLLEFVNNTVNNYDYISDFISNIAIKLNLYLEQLENIPNINIEFLMQKYSTNIVSIAKQLLESFVKFLGSIPYISIFIITLFISTYFIAKDIDKIEYSFYNMFSEPTKTKVKNIKREIIKSILGYIKAYAILMGITFIVTWLSLRVFDIPYSMTLGIIAGLLDLIPFLGIVVIYLPFIVYYCIVKNYLIAITLIVVFALLSLLRQVLEPKLVSTNIGISPLATLAAIFIGIQVKGIIGIVFFLGLTIMHQILKKVDIL